MRAGCAAASADAQAAANNTDMDHCGMDPNGDMGMESDDDPWACSPKAGAGVKVEQQEQEHGQQQWEVKKLEQELGDASFGPASLEDPAGLSWDLASSGMRRSLSPFVVQASADGLGNRSSSASGSARPACGKPSAAQAHFSTPSEFAFGVAAKPKVGLSEFPELAALLSSGNGLGQLAPQALPLATHACMSRAVVTTVEGHMMQPRSASLPLPAPAPSVQAAPAAASAAQAAPAPCGALAGAAPEPERQVRPAAAVAATGTVGMGAIPAVPAHVLLSGGRSRSCSGCLQTEALEAPAAAVTTAVALVPLPGATAQVPKPAAAPACTSAAQAAPGTSIWDPLGLLNKQSLAPDGPDGCCTGAAAAAAAAAATAVPPVATVPATCGPSLSFPASSSTSMSSSTLAAALPVLSTLNPKLGAAAAPAAVPAHLQAFNAVQQALQLQVLQQLQQRQALQQMAALQQAAAAQQQQQQQMVLHALATLARAFTASPSLPGPQAPAPAAAAAASPSAAPATTVAAAAAPAALAPPPTATTAPAAAFPASAAAAASPASCSNPAAPDVKATAAAAKPTTADSAVARTERGPRKRKDTKGAAPVEPCGTRALPFSVALHGVSAAGAVVLGGAGEVAVARILSEGEYR